MVKVWVCFVGLLGMISESYNVSSVMCGGVGFYIVNFIIVFVNMIYGCMGMIEDSVINGFIKVGMIGKIFLVFLMFVVNLVGFIYDVVYVYVECKGI